jgi:hypothetical protein
MIGRPSWVGWDSQASIYGAASVQHLNQGVRCPSPPARAVVTTVIQDVRSTSSEPNDTRCMSAESQDADSISTGPRPSFFQSRKTSKNDPALSPEVIREQEISRESTPQRRPSKEDNPAYNACCLNKTPLRFPGDSLVTGGGGGVVVLTRHEGEQLPHMIGLPGKTGRLRMSIGAMSV